MKSEIKNISDKETIFVAYKLSELKKNNLKVYLNMKKLIDILKKEELVI